MALVMTSASITPEMRERINYFWTRVPRPCEICNSFTWSVEENLAQLTFLQNVPHTFAQQPVFPLVVITCQTCGNTKLLNALKLGWKPGAGQ